MKLNITKGRLQQIVAEEYQKLSAEGLLTEAEGDVFKEGDKVVDDRNNDTGTVVSPMANGAVVELEDGRTVKMVGIAHTTTPHDIIYDTVQESLN